MMEIDVMSLTLRQAKEIVATFGVHAGVAPVPPQPPAHPMVGEYVILRCYSAGVHAGVLMSQTGDEAVLANSRRLWSWTANDGVALSGLAVHGLRSGKVDTRVPRIALTGVIETIPCSKAARESIDGA